MHRRDSPRPPVEATEPESLGSTRARLQGGLAGSGSHDTRAHPETASRRRTRCGSCAASPQDERTTTSPNGYPSSETYCAHGRCRETKRGQSALARDRIPSGLSPRPVRRTSVARKGRPLLGRRAGRRGRPFAAPPPGRGPPRSLRWAQPNGRSCGRRPPSSPRPPLGERHPQEHVFPTRYRLPRRRGSVASRNSHSRPNRCIRSGAWRLTPAVKSKAAPTPADVTPMLSVMRRASKSCRGVPCRPRRRARSAGTDQLVVVPMVVGCQRAERRASACRRPPYLGTCPRSGHVTGSVSTPRLPRRSAERPGAAQDRGCARRRTDHGPAGTQPSRAGQQRRRAVCRREDSLLVPATDSDSRGSAAQARRCRR